MANPCGSLGANSHALILSFDSHTTRHKRTPYMQQGVVERQRDAQHYKSQPITLAHNVWSVCNPPGIVGASSIIGSKAGAAQAACAMKKPFHCVRPRRSILVEAPVAINSVASERGSRNMSGRGNRCRLWSLKKAAAYPRIKLIGNLVTPTRYNSRSKAMCKLLQHRLLEQFHAQTICDLDWQFHT